MKKIVLATIIVAFISCATTESRSVSGVIYDATMNTMTIISGTDTLFFSTLDADKVATNGILIGDSAQVFYTGKLNKSGIGESCAVSKVIVTPISMIGSWVQPIPGMSGVQGVKFDADGTASSINMATLVYDSWVRADGKLFLGGESIGNGQTIQLNEDWTIDTLTADSLVISNGGYTQRFVRLK